MTTVGILTGGGDCPGLNAVIRAVVRTGAKHGFDAIGIRDGWLGLVAGNVEPLTDYSVTGILPKGGTILGTSRTNPFKNEADLQRLRDNIRKFGLDAIVAIGGEDTLGVANKLSQLGIPVVGVPKTIDNDVAATDYTFGFDTAVSIVTEAIDRLHTTAESHHRIMVVEVMGRYAGWIATMAGIAGGADEILIPEIPFDLDEVTHHLRVRYERGKKFSIVVVAEGAQPKGMVEAIAQSARTDEFGHVTLGGVGNYLRDELEKRLDMEVRVTVLGHVQRGGSPTARDRVLATRFGVAAADLIRDKDFGKMVALRGDDIVAVPLEEAVANLKTVDMDLYKIASIFYGG
ncbi:6-phosphofructokinase [Methanoculleus sp. Afa-1]|uniref:Pyrophosphate--fructose 6-phosphate 1-phosphotransferase n=1 Tax=Methanoculleus formosensis TaxID=2590886 RepID=A0A9E5DE16_9EURY|nr:ATP-dependent 6-phosphofructokinase [Methanoculleus sp. Afa-1]MCT8338143.1 6-phosphofructokinase [Methanoculleus sp. Afa-1]